MTGTSEKSKVERVQLGVRMEKHMVQVLKGLAELKNMTLGELLEKIVLHSFEPIEGDEGESSASPHSKSDLIAIAGLRRVYGMDYEVHGTRDFVQDVEDSTGDEN
jgi:predicted DNA-binding ribbon-helix-helix protein